MPFGKLQTPNGSAPATLPLSSLVDCSGSGCRSYGSIKSFASWLPRRLHGLIRRLYFTVTALLITFYSLHNRRKKKRGNYGNCESSTILGAKMQRSKNDCSPGEKQDSLLLTNTKWTQSFRQNVLSPEIQNVWPNTATGGISLLSRKLIQFTTLTSSLCSPDAAVLNKHAVAKFLTPIFFSRCSQQHMVLVLYTSVVYYNTPLGEASLAHLEHWPCSCEEIEEDWSLRAGYMPQSLSTCDF